MTFAQLLAGVGKYAPSALAIGTPLVGAVIGARAAKGAARTQAEAVDRGLAAQTEQFQATQNNLAPWLQAGASVLPELTRGVSAGGEFARPFSMEDFEQDPGYQFRLGEGNRAIENNAAARGMLLSGATLKALQRYGQDYASLEYGNAWDRHNTERQRRVNALAGVADIGRQTTGLGAQLRQHYGASAADLMTQRGNVDAAGKIGQTNFLQQGLSGALNNWQLGEMLRKLRLA